MIIILKVSVLIIAMHAINLYADDWPRFRGPAGSGIAKDSESLPDQWSPTLNLAWKSALSGPGASSPIIFGNKVFVTSYSGYGLGSDEPGELENLIRSLQCFDLRTGKLLWQKDVKASLPEDLYDQSGVSSHGYATHTPVSDGNNVYCFFGKGGVYAFDLNGNELWHANAGKESDPPKWGSSSSPVIHKNTLIITASAESQSIIGFDKLTGKKKWQQEASGLDGMWGTPILVKVDNHQTDLVMLVAGELWGLDPESGRLRWYSKATDSQQAYTSVISQGNRVFAFTGQGSRSLRLEVNGLGNIEDSNTLWTSSVSATYASPVLHESKIYVVSQGILTVVEAASGKRLKQIRLKDFQQTGNPRFGSLDYASPLIVDGRLFYLNAKGQTYVFELNEEIEQLAVNEITTDHENFWGSPAVSDGRIVLRSSSYLYCIASVAIHIKSQTPTAFDLTPADRPQHIEIISNEELNVIGQNKELGYRKNDITSEADGGQSKNMRPKRPRRPALVND
ncbi:PQQ-binding-like beta-propeller repeat protein [uncultured Rubinisphaera sp.]|mgnify:CR=1 FL=1|uniref:PQQ-binding-like beta-propeller repeat protein n=1 Tax=uncultured Rubinisphaera sp. TaxID=1678686 RepID=UPI0030DC0F5E